MNSKQTRAKQRKMMSAVHMEISKISGQEVSDALIEAYKDLKASEKENDQLQHRVDDLESMICKAARNMTKLHQILLINYVEPKYHNLFRGIMSRVV